MVSCLLICFNPKYTPTNSLASTSGQWQRLPVWQQCISPQWDSWLPTTISQWLNNTISYQQPISDMMIMILCPQLIVLFSLVVYYLVMTFLSTNKNINTLSILALTILSMKQQKLHIFQQALFALD